MDFSEIERRVFGEYCRRDSEDALAFAVANIKLMSQTEAQSFLRQYRIVRNSFLVILALITLWACFEVAYG